MTKLVYVTIDNVRIPIQRNNYNVSTRDIVSDGSGTTEAGTIIRDIIRRKVPTVSFSLVLTKSKLQDISKLLYMDEIMANILDADGEYRDYTMYLSSYNVSLLHDNVNGGIWQADITLESF